MNEGLTDENFTNREVFHAGEGDVGMRVDAFISRVMSVSRARAQKLLETATVNGQTVKAKVTLRMGDRIEIEPPGEGDEIPQSATPEELLRAPEIPILHEDDALIVLVKPRGVTVHAGAGETGATLVDILRSLKKPLSSVGPAERAGIVHRLDKDTSGVMLVAKTDAAHWNLAAQFEARQIEKHYTALVNGIPAPRGRIEAAIERSHSNRKKMTVAPGGRLSITEYEVVKTWAKFALLDINLLTGRTHQIRVHLNYLHHPIAGDAIYGGFHRALTCAPSDRVKNAIETLNGQALHAYTIAFAHPTTGERMHFEAPLPPTFTELLEALDEAT